MFFINENIGYAVRYDQGENIYPQYDQGKTYKTTNGGSSWTAVNNTAYYNLFFINENIGYATRLAGEGGSLYKTTNGGTSWTVINNQGYSNLNFINENIGYGTKGGEAGSIYKTTNGGVTWTEVNTDGYSNLFFINENTGYGTRNDATPLIIAGGGGGSSSSQRTQPIGGQITEWGLGNPSTLPPSSTDSYYGGAGGGSWHRNGLPGDYNAGGGKGWNNYLQGGIGNTKAWGNYAGGFGGGGGATWSGVAGGGYNGGPRVSSYGNGTPGGSGGGSYNGGSNQNNVAAVGGNTHGKVIISKGGSIWTFTNCGAWGINGPTQNQCNSSYSGGSLNGLVTLDNGIQIWQVPSTGTYTIEVTGARGGGGAQGAKIIGDFSLNQGENLRVAVGQMGLSNGSGKGGGGGTFVSKGDSQGGKTYKTTNGGVTWTAVNDNVYHDIFFIK